MFHICRKLNFFLKMKLIKTTTIYGTKKKLKQNRISVFNFRILIRIYINWQNNLQQIVSK